jgi:hypothetical protein
VEYRYSSTLSLASEQDAGMVVNATSRPLHSRLREQVTVLQEDGKEPESVWMGADYYYYYYYLFGLQMGLYPVALKNK